MKTRYFKWIFLAAAMMAACTPEGLGLEQRSDRLRGVMDADLAVTKSILVDNPGVKLESFWEAGDRIGVYGGSAENALFTVKAEDLSADRKTADFSTDGTIPAGKLTAYAPYQKEAKKDGGAIVVTFPAKQSYVTYDGVVQLDPAANILLGEGSKAGGLTFRNMIAVLKIGQVFEQTTLVKTVEFRDLSGAAVTGAMKLTGGSSPKAEITGDGKILTLDLGEGLEYPEGSMRPIFLIVPARSYAQGFEITFIDDKGGKTVKTVGTTMGKTLERGVVYLIGDISGREYPVESSTTFKEGTILMTPEILDKVVLTVVEEEWLRDENGDVIYNEHKAPLRRPVLNLRVSKDLNPVEGAWLIFDQPSSTLPEGGIYKITSCQDVGNDCFSVEAHFEPDFTAPFEEITVGTPLYDEEGNYLEDGGVELDLTSYVQAILDADGNPVPFSISPSGSILIGEEETAALLGMPETKGPMAKTFSPPRMTFKHSENNAEVSFGAQAKLHTKLAVRMMGGELQYIYFTVNPVFELSADFVLKAEFNYSLPFQLFQLVICPIPVAPGVQVTPTINFSGEIGVGGNVQFSTSVSYTYDMGTYGVIYNRGMGFSKKYKQAPAAETEIVPSIGGASASIYAYGKLTAAPYLSIYGMLGLGVEAGFSLKFGAMIEDKTQSTKLFLTPELELIPSIAVLGGRFTKRFSDLTTNIEFDPIWEKYLSPKVITASAGPVSVPLSEKFYTFAELSDDDSGGGMSMQVTKAPKRWHYSVELKEATAIDYNVEVRVYESILPVDSDDFVWGEKPEGFFGYSFQKYLDAGIPHMYPWLEYIRNPDFGTDYFGSPRLVRSYLAGTYSAATEGMTIQGEFIEQGVSSGHAYWADVYLVHGDSERKINTSSGNNRVYFWPNDFWGRSYKESETQDFRGSGNTGDSGTGQ